MKPGWSMIVSDIRSPIQKCSKWNNTQISQDEHCSVKSLAWSGRSTESHPHETQMRGLISSDKQKNTVTTHLVRVSGIPRYLSTQLCFCLQWLLFTGSHVLLLPHPQVTHQLLLQRTRCVLHTGEYPQICSYFQGQGWQIECEATVSFTDKLHVQSTGGTYSVQATTISPGAKW